MVQKPPGAWQTLTINVSPLQASIGKAASRWEDVQGVQMFPVIEHHDVQENLVRMHVSIPFK